MNIAVISVGSNIEPEKNVSKAASLLEKEQKLLQRSAFITTKPIGSAEQLDFLNGAFLVATELDIQGLKRSLRRIERKMGRVRQAEKYSPRIIDLDIVVWNGEVVDKDFYERDFLRNAVLEVYPQLNNKKK